MLFLFENVFRKLGEDHGYEYQSAAPKFGTGESLVEQQPAKEQGEGRFQTHDQRCRSGLQMLLANDLQAEGNAHGQNARIAQRQPAIQDVFPNGSFRQEHSSRGHNCGNNCLNAVDPQTVKAAGELVHQRDLYCETKSTAQQEQITLVDLCDTDAAQQIETGNGNGYADPGRNGNPLPKEQAQYRHQHNVHGGNKACLTGGGILDAQLLQAACNEQGYAADDAGFPELFVGPDFEIGFFATICSVCSIFIKAPTETRDSSERFSKEAVTKAS